MLGVVGTAAPAQWNASVIDYSLSFPATLPDGRNVTLTAEPDRSMALDWYSFDAATADAAGTAATAVTTSLIPGHVRFQGMPNSRFWDFESNKTDFGSVVADVQDAGRLLLLDFMLIHGIGWFIVPLDVPVGSFCQIASLTLHDVFGGSMAIPRANPALGPAGGRSTLFSITDRTTGGVAGALFTAPTCTAARQTSEAVEDVRLFRDDAAEVVWAVEETAPDALVTPPQVMSAASLSRRRQLYRSCGINFKRLCRRLGSLSCRRNPAGRWWTSLGPPSQGDRMRLGGGSFLLYLY